MLLGLAQVAKEDDARCGPRIFSSDGSARSGGARELSRTPFGHRAALKLMFASLLRMSADWRRVVISEFERRQLEEPGDDLHQESWVRTTACVLAASRHRI